MKNFQIKGFFRSLSTLSRRILLLSAVSATAVSLPFGLYALFAQAPFLEAVELQRSLPLVLENWLLCLCVGVGGAFLADAVEKDGT